MAIKDSGKTREFETGAHRDASIGKGRCDLLPLMEVADVMDDEVLRYIAMFFINKKEQHLINALIFALPLIPEYNNDFPTMMLEVSHLYEEGANKYGENNWKKGMPLKVYLDSGIRHYLKALRGDNDEPHYRGFVWNILGCLWTMHHVKGALEEFKEFAKE
ncbi:MAG: hypothetical protein IJT36_03315 [Alphaproteobacteria bacterium]|nr:hypothetical protein [Alphaproteobacteria bacterium]